MKDTRGNLIAISAQLEQALSCIRELEAELQVRDNMGDEVLRILREATGKRDFHSEMEAAEYAAELIRKGGWRPIAEAPEKTTLRVGMYINGVWFSPVCEYDKSIAIRHEYTHFLLLPEPPAREVTDERG